MTSSHASPIASDSVLTLSDEQRALERAASAAAREVWDPASLLRDGPPTVAQVRAIWRSVAGLGVLGLAAPAHSDGGTVADLAVVMGAWGRLHFPGPLLSQSAVVVPVLAGLAETSDRAAELLAGVLEAERVVAVADGATLGIDQAGDHAVLSGSIPVVADGQLADDLLVRLPAGEEFRWGLVPLTDPRVTRTGLDNLDMSRLAASIELAAAPVSLLGPAEAQLYPTVALACLAAELTGCADGALYEAVEHIGRREQFGRPVGSFQGLKHRAARALVAVELSRSMNRAATDWLSRGADPAPGRVLALEAAVRAADVAVGATWDLIGMLGGIGFTWEHPAHLAYRQARAGRMALGGCRSWQRELEAGV